MGPLAALRRPQWLILLGAVAGIAAGLAVYALGPHRYQAGVEELAVVAPTGPEPSPTTPAARAASNTTDADVARRVRSYLPIATSAWVLQPVIDDLRLPTDVPALAEEVRVTNPPGTVLVRISVTDTDATRAATVATAIGARFGTAVRSLESSPGRRPITLRPVQAFGPRTLSSGRNAPTYALVGLLAGLVVGAAAAAFARHRTRTIRDANGTQAVTGARPLAVIPLAGAPVGAWTGAPARAEGSPEVIRALTTNLALTDLDHRLRCFVVTSPTAGAGATEAACSIAGGLARDGHRVVLIEADLRHPQVCRHLLLPHSGAGLTSVLARQVHLDDVFIPRLDGRLAVLPAGPLPPSPAAVLGSQLMSELLADLRARFDYVVLAGAPLLDDAGTADTSDAAGLARITDGAIVAVRQGRTTRTQLARAEQAITAANGRLIGTLLTVGERRPATPSEPESQQATPEGTPSRPVLPTPRREHAAPARATGAITLTESAVDLHRVPRPEDLPLASSVALPSDDDPAPSPRAMHPASSTRVIRRAPASGGKPLSIVLPDAGPGAAAATVTRRRRVATAPGRPDLTVLTGSADPGPPGVKRYRTGAQVSLVDDAIRIAWQSAGTGVAAGRHRKP